MTGADFQNLAARLAAETSPAALRTATSRAYYGAFHVACEMLRDAGIVLPKDAARHEKVPQILGASGDPDVIATASKLGALRVNRNEADYQLDKVRPENQAAVLLHVQVAAEIIACIQQCNAGGPKAGIRQSVRDYAAKVQGLQVR